MRPPRILGNAANASNVYHCVSRAIERRFIFGSRAEKEVFRRFLFAQAQFSGVRILTYCIMGNHFHLLLEVPQHNPSALAEISDEELLERLSCISSADRLQEIRGELRWRKSIGDGAYRSYRQTIERRMCDLPCFMKELKQRYSRWFNQRQERDGPLWNDRYKSVLVETRFVAGGSLSKNARKRLESGALLAIAAYIELNPVRAGIVADPKDYRWCGYAEAVGGSQQFRGGIGRIVGRDPDAVAEDPIQGREWTNTASRYRLYVYEQAASRGTEKQPRSPAVSQQSIDNERERGGELPTATILRCRIRYFTDGLALGGSAFLEETFAANRTKMNVAREVGAREPRDLALGDLRVMRDLRGDVS